MDQMTPVVALLEVLDRDGSVRHSLAVQSWPVQVGRALDNDLVLDDPYTAAHHFSLGLDEAGQLVLAVGDTLNGLAAGARHLAAGETLLVPASLADKPLPLTLGRTHLRLRLAAHELPPEQRLGATRVLTQGMPTLALLLLATAGVLGFDAWLEAEPDLLTKSLASLSISALAFGLGWCGVWTLLSKVFSRQGHFGWHLRVMLLAVLAWQAVLAGSGLLAFALSWPWVTDFNFIPGYAIVGTMLYFHLQAVEPLHPRRTFGLAAASALTGMALTCWFNVQGTDRIGSELYMNHLFPPALRVAKPVELPQFMQGVAELQAGLDAKAKTEKDDAKD